MTPPTYLQKNFYNMYVILYSDIFNEYFESNKKVLKSEEDFLRWQLIQNPKNTIILSTKYVSFLELAFPNTHENYNQFCSLILEIMDNKSKSIASCPNSTNITEEFIHLCSSITTDFFIPISDNILLPVPKTASIKAIQKPNFHWAYCELAAKHHVYIEHQDFTTDPGIQTFFDQLFSFPHKINTVYYFDRYAKNTPQHNYFNSLSGKGYPIEVFTYGISRISNGRGVRYTAEELATLKQDILNKFGAPCKVSQTPSKVLIHERRIMFNNLIIDANEDFCKLKRHVLTWRIDISFSPDSFNQSLQKISRFSEIL